jgi:hypothetical protein
MSDGKRWKDGLTRRSLVGGAVGLAAVGGAGIGALTLGSSKATAQTSGVTASDVSIDSNDGTVTELFVDPNLDVTWDNFETDVHEVKASLFAHLAGGSASSSFGSKTVTLSSPGASGSITINVGKFSLLSSSGGPIDATDLEDTTEDGTAEQTDIVVSVRINFYDSGSTDIGVYASAQDTFTVSVNNLESTATVSGSFNTGGS